MVVLSGGCELCHYQFVVFFFLSCDVLFYCDIYIILLC